MNERYTYGYATGWNVENEYMNSLKEIMYNYNYQMGEIEKIFYDMRLVDADIIRTNNITEEQMREWYYNDYTDEERRIRSFESYKRDIEEAIKQKNETLKAEVESNNDRYQANLYRLIEVKNDTKKVIESRKTELELLLSEKRAQLSSVGFPGTPKYDENRNIINSDELKEIRRKFDELQLETRKIEHALQTLEDMSKLVELTEEENVLAGNGLTEKQKQLYKNIQTRGNESNNDLSNNESTNNDIPDDNSSDDDSSNDEPENDEISNDEISNDEIPLNIDEIINALGDDDDDIKKYKELFANYEKLLEIYEEELDTLYELHQLYEKKEIEYSEYNKQAEFVLAIIDRANMEHAALTELYEKIQEKKRIRESLTEEQLVNAINVLDKELEEELHYLSQMLNGTRGDETQRADELKAKISKLKEELARREDLYYNLTEEQLLQKLAELEKEGNELWQQGVHENTPDAKRYHEVLEEIRKIKNALAKRKGNDELQKSEPPRRALFIEKDKDVEPPKPEPIPEPKPEPKKEKMDLYELIYRIKGGDTYSKLDSFTQKYKGIKVINYHRFRARTVLDKPFRLLGTAFSSVVVGTGKIFANLAYKFSKERKLKLDAMVKRVNELSIAEVDFLMSAEGLGNTSKLIELQTYIPDAVFHALQNRFSARKAQLLSEANTLIDIYFNKLIEMYNESKDIQEKLASPNLSEEEKKSLTAKNGELLKNMVLLIENIENARNVDSIINDGSLKDERSLVKENTVGGINSRLKVDASVDRLQGKVGRISTQSYKNDDLMSYVEAFLYQEKINIENTKYKRTARNWFGKTSVGSREWRPYVENFDYVKHDYVGTVLRTAAIVVSVCNIINRINLQNQVTQLQNELNVANQKITYLNNEVARLQGIINTCAGDPDKLVATYAEYLQQQAALYQATCDYYGATAQAGFNGLSSPSMVTNDPSGIYKTIDTMGHTNSANWINAINNTNGLPIDQQLKALQQIEIEMQQACVDLAKQTATDVMTHVNATPNFDFSALAEFYNSVGAIDPDFIGSALQKLIDLSYATGNVQAIGLINTYNLSVGTGGLVAQLATILGESAVKVLDDNKKENVEKVDLDERKENLKGEIEKAKIDVHEIARKRFEQAMTEWEEKHFFYRLTHKKEKPQLADIQNEVIDEFMTGRGYK